MPIQKNMWAPSFKIRSRAGFKVICVSSSYLLLFPQNIEYRPHCEEQSDSMTYFKNFERTNREKSMSLYEEQNLENICLHAVLHTNEIFPTINKKSQPRSQDISFAWGLER